MDRCAQCDKPLHNCEEIHAVEGNLYCCKQCAIESQAEVIRQSARDTAAEWYNNSAEIISPEDIGLKNEYIVVITEVIIHHTKVHAADSIKAVETARKQFENCVYDEVADRETTYDAIQINKE